MNKMTTKLLTMAAITAGLTFSANAAILVQFSPVGLDFLSGNTAISVSEYLGTDTATAGGSGGVNTAAEIGFSAQSAGSVRQTGFRLRDDTFGAGGGYATYAGLGSGFLSDTITLSSTGITGGSPTLINQFYFDDNEFYPLVMDGLANNGDTLSFAGSPDTTGVLPIPYVAFFELWGDTLNKSDGIYFQFGGQAPEPSSLALLAMGGLLLAKTQRKRKLSKNL